MSNTTGSNPSITPLWRISDLCARLNLKRSAIYAGVAKGVLPTPVKLSAKGAARWIPAEVELFLADCAAKRNAAK